MTTETFREYQREAARTGGSDLTPGNEDKGLNCAAMGLAGEAGEVCDLVKKWQHHRAPRDVEKLQKELGDVLWYLAHGCNVMGFDLGDIAAQNVAKLRARYPDGFSTEASIARAEYEYEIPKRDAEELMLLCEIRVSKTRYYLPGGFELDVFEEQLNGLELLEYESDDVESMPGIPEGFRVLEVTGDPVFNNIRLAKDGIPESLKARSLQE